MTKEEKIEKLKKLGVYEQFVNNVSTERFLSLLLNDNSDWEYFIKCSFVWEITPEGNDFWLNIYLS